MKEATDEEGGAIAQQLRKMAIINQFDANNWRITEVCNFIASCTKKPSFILHAVKILSSILSLGNVMLYSGWILFAMAAAGRVQAIKP